MIAYKFLRADGTSVFAQFPWPLPSGGAGAWVGAEVDPCRTRIHACRRGDLPLWAGRRLYEIELDGEILEQATKVVASHGRLLRRIEAWDDAFRDRYTRMCADRAHELARGASLEGWEAVIEPSVPEGPALLGFVAARIAEELSGPDAYTAERARQADWLAERLAL
ncbi:MAG TPA: hypothetical protein VHJ39_03280 [Solirubrobacteraceae bacterium]|nr:hypothetical protein [Solirubrobacteraceae bacterium]